MILNNLNNLRNSENLKGKRQMKMSKNKIKEKELLALQPLLQEEAAKKDKMM